MESAATGMVSLPESVLVPGQVPVPVQVQVQVLSQDVELVQVEVLVEVQVRAVPMRLQQDPHYDRQGDRYSGHCRCPLQPPWGFGCDSSCSNCEWLRKPGAPHEANSLCGSACEYRRCGRGCRGG